MNTNSVNKVIRVRVQEVLCSMTFCGVLLLFAGCPPQPFNQVEWVDVPDCVGMPIDEATNLLEDSGLRVGTLDLDTKSTWFVVEQNPVPGTMVVKDSEIKLTIMPEEELQTEPDDELDHAEEDSVFVFDNGSATVGYEAPDFITTFVDGTPFRLSDYRGHVIILDFWATWCAPCRVALPKLVEIALEYEDSDVLLITVNVAENSEKITSFLQRLGWYLPTVLDPEGVISIAYGVDSLPKTLIIDNSGIVQFIHHGLGDPNQIRVELDSLIYETES